MIRRYTIAVECSLAAGALAAGALGAAFAARFGGAAPAALLISTAVAAVVVLTISDTRNAILAVFATFPVAGAATGLPVLQVTEAATLALALLVALVMLAAGEVPVGWSPRLVWGVALLAWTLIALPTAIDGTLALKQVAQLVAGLVFASVLLRVCRSSDDVRRVLAGFVGIALAVTAVGLASGGATALQPALQGATAQGRLRATFDQPNQLGAFAAMAALVALALAVGARTRRGRAAAAVACVLILPGLLLSLSRGGWIGFGLGLCMVVATVARSRRIVLATVPALLLAVGLLASTASFGSDLSTIRLRAEALTVRSPYDHRNVIYAEAWREIRADPWTGVGPGGFPAASARGDSEAATTRALHAHTLFLTWAAECGLPAAAIIAAFAVSLAGAVRRSARAAARHGSEADRGLALGLGAVLLSVLGQGMVDYVFRNEVLFLSLWTVIGALLAHERAVRMR
jgi:O-antigen ligase